MIWPVTLVLKYAASILSFHCQLLIEHINSKCRSTVPLRSQGTADIWEVEAIYRRVGKAAYTGDCSDVLSCRSMASGKGASHSKMVPHLLTQLTMQLLQLLSHPNASGTAVISSHMQHLKV